MSPMKTDYEPVIGLEVHCQVRTRSKMFCGCRTQFGEAPNALTCPVCLGHPGVLPVPNREAIVRTIQTGLLLSCDIDEFCKFDRKNYFYPDMPKNYQISQYDMPLCRGGGVTLDRFSFPKDAQDSPCAAARKRVRLTRIHLEEDVAKSTHFETTSGIDFNRAGTPLMEIVTEADIASPEEAFAFLTALRLMLVQAGVSDADMEKGQLRCDCNVSVRPRGQRAFGTKCEIKNMNSISGVRRALAYEIERQIEVLGAGGRITQETRRWDDGIGQTSTMRSKEEVHDYRYFPDPDLMPIKTSDGLLDEARTRLIELPIDRADRYTRAFEVTEYDASVLASDLDMALYFERASSGASNPKGIANYLLNDLLSALTSSGKVIADCPVRPEALRDLVSLIDGGKINSKQAKEVFKEMFETGAAPADIVKSRGLEQVSDTGAIEALARQAIDAHPGPAQDFLDGKASALNFLTGQVMKLSKGKANPKLASDIIERLLRSR